MREFAGPKGLEETIGNLAARWSGAKPLLPGFGLLARGEPVPVARVADAAGVSVEKIEKRLQSARCERDAQGRLTDLFGMTLKPTSIALEIEGKTVYSCCGLWALMIPALIGKKVAVRSADPLSREPVQLLAAPDAVESVAPPGAVATLAVAGAKDIAANVGAAFCSHIRYFSSRQSAERFAQADPRRSVVEISELHAAAKDLLRAIGAELKD